jgi:hypothetical protein
VNAESAEQTGSTKKKHQPEVESTINIITISFLCGFPKDENFFLFQ